MKHRKKIHCMAVFMISTLFLSCIKSNMNDCGLGRVTLKTDWSQRTEGVEIPSEYILEVDGYKTLLSGATNLLEYPDRAGIYRFSIYNRADKITVDNLTASVAVLARSTTTIDPCPGWFFTWADDVTVEQDNNQTIRSVMTQQVRELDITLAMASGDPATISSVQSTLDGIAGAWDLRNSLPTGAPKKVIIPPFLKAGNTFSAYVRLIGIIPQATQHLQTTVTFTDGSTELIDSNLHELFKTFNVDKHIKSHLYAELHATHFSAEINNWVLANNRPGTAN